MKTKQTQNVQTNENTIKKSTLKTKHFQTEMSKCNLRSNLVEK